jgi:thiosulfate dehydrogenase [quinone] large subunit
MAVIQPTNRADEGVTTGTPAATSSPSGPLHKALAVLRIAFGITFVWAFLDKLLALGFHTGYDQEGNLDRFGDAAWINGGSPTEGFLSFGVPANNPFKDVFTSMAGQGWVDWLFMLGLLGIGVSLLTGVAMRIGTAAGALMYSLMYVAVLPLENNPIVDDHLVGVIVMAVLALAYAGRTWGLGTWWESQDIVKKNPALR